MDKLNLEFLPKTSEFLVCLAVWYSHGHELMEKEESEFNAPRASGFDFSCAEYNFCRKLWI